MEDHPFLKIPRHRLDANQVAKLTLDIFTCEDPALKAKLIAYNQPPKKKEKLRKKTSK